MPELVHYEIRDHVAVLTVDNPPVNALSPGVPEAIEAAVERAGKDPAARAVVPIGAGTTYNPTFRASAAAFLAESSRAETPSMRLSSR
jgi:enoyl-CoA hydratase/carnithine racemase